MRPVNVAYAAGARAPPSVNVLLAGTAKSTWNRKSCQFGTSSVLSQGSGAPAGGRIEPSRSPGSSAPQFGSCSPGVMSAAAAPVSMAARSMA